MTSRSSIFGSSFVRRGLGGVTRRWRAPDLGLADELLVDHLVAAKRQVTDSPSPISGSGASVPRRLRRVSPDSPGWSRRRNGRGFVYLDEGGRRFGAADVARCKALAIPPAWRDVWICPLPNGHLQAVGTDDGRPAPVPLPSRLARPARPCQARAGSRGRRAAYPEPGHGSTSTWRSKACPVSERLPSRSACSTSACSVSVARRTPTTTGAMGWRRSRSGTYASRRLDRPSRIPPSPGSTSVWSVTDGRFARHRDAAPTARRRAATAALPGWSPLARHHLPRHQRVHQGRRRR